MSDQPKIKAGKFKGMDRKEMLEIVRSKVIHLKKNKHSLGSATNFENRRYKKWLPVSDIKRSFFIWRGRYSKSTKEKEISEILKGENLRFYREVSFDMKKRFDFYIPLIDLIIEYDGKQHFTEFKEMENDKTKELILKRLGVKYIRYNRTHNLLKQIKHDLIYHPILK